jgi:hypothetical protein
MENTSNTTKGSNEINTLLTAVVRDGVLNNPEYKRYCDYYKFIDTESDKCIMGFCIWKSFGNSI